MSVSRVGPWRTLAFASVLVGLPISSGCEGTVDTDAGTVECGPGTIEEDGQCVPDPDNEPEGGTDGGVDLECGPGTVLNVSGTACVPDLDCPEGTTENEDGTGCVLDCENPFLYDADTDQCVCALGLRPTEDGSDCEIDPALCGEGTLFQGGACVPIEPPPPADDDLNGGNPVVIELDDSKPVEVGGVIGPVDRVDGADLDVFEFTTTEAFTRVRIQMVSFGLPNGAFFVFDNESGFEAPAYARMGVGGENRRAVRELTLPFAGTYSILASDLSNLQDAVFGIPTAFPVGGEDQDYALSIEILSASPATTAAVDGTEYTGQHESVDAYRVETSAAPAGSILNAVLAGNADVDPTCNTIQVLWYVDAAGNYQEIGPDADCNVNTLLPQPSGGIRFHVDYFARTTGPTYDYSVSINDVPVADGPQPNDGPVDGNTGGEDLSFFRMTAEADHVYRARAQLPSTTTLDAQFLLVNASTLLVAEQGVEVTSEGNDFLEIQFYVDADEAGEYFLVVADAGEESPFVEPNYNVRFTLDDATVEYTANPTVAGAAVTNSETKPGANDWLGPWTMVRVDEISDLTIGTDSGVGFRAVSPTTMEELDGVTPAPPARTLPINEGVCDEAFAEVIGESGDFTFTLANAADNWTNGDWGTSCTRDGTDFSIRMATQPAGTRAIIETLEEGDNATADTNVALIDTIDCDQANAVCVGFNDDGGPGARSLLEYTFTGDEQNLILVVDSWNSFGPLENGTVRVRVTILPENASELTYRLAPGTRVLTQALGGDGQGDFVHTADATASPFSWETEPNNASGAATSLPLDADPALNGFLAAGDFDWWAIEVPEAGLLTVDVATGPLGLDDEALTVAVVGTDGTTELSTVTGLLDLTQSTFITTAGTYFVSVGATESLAAFDYTLSWSLDTTVPAPPTCEAPRTLDGPGSYEGTTAGADLWADTGCLAEASGFGSENYDGVPDDVWAVTIPAGSTIDLSATADGDLALALITDCENGDCLAAADATFPGFFDPSATEQLVYNNSTNDPVEALFIVTTFGNAPVEYTLEVGLVGATCFPGQSQCSADATALETCNDAGDGFESIACDAGCAFDEFEQTASCTAYCGEGTDLPALDCNADNTRVLTCAADQGRYEESDVCLAGCEVETDVDDPTIVTNAFCAAFCGTDTDNPDSRCNGAVLETCAADQLSYEETTCAVECTDEVDGGGLVVSGQCTFGLCADFDATVCVTETFDGFGDVAVLRDCNATASDTTATACANGCNVDGDDCEPFAAVVNPIVVTANPGSCDDAAGLAAATLVDASGTFTVTLDAAAANDTDGLDCSLGDGHDVFLRLAGDRTAGSTVIVTAEGVGAADPVLAFFSACDATCVGRVDTTGIETSTYTYTGDEVGDVYVVIDEFSADTDVDVNVTVEFRDLPPAICDEAANGCDAATNVLSTCDAGAGELENFYCETGCNPAGTNCDVCPNAVALDLTALPSNQEIDLTGGNELLTGSCGAATSGPERVFTLTSATDGVFEVSAVGVNSTFDDTVIYTYEGECGATELTCDDDGADGFGSLVTINATAGVTYYVVVDTRSSFNDGFPVTLTVEDVTP